MQILKINNQRLEDSVDIVSSLLKKGRVVVLPTDTVYGLICNAANKKAVFKVFKIKKRDQRKPLPVFVKDLQAAKKIAVIGKDQEKIAKAKWPGKFTFVLPRKKGIKLYGINSDTIALRIPKFKLINQLLDQTGFYLIGTSANISGLKASTLINEVLTQFENKQCKPDLVVDAGNLKASKASTVLDLTLSAVKKLR